MRAHNIFFWAVSFFLIGVLAASLVGGFESAWLIVLAIGILIPAILFFIGNRSQAILALAIIIGGFYYLAYDLAQKDEVFVFGEKVILTGVVREIEYGLESQKIRVGEVQVTTQRYPEYAYGDQLKIEGMLKKIPDDRRGYFSKEDIFALMSFPKIDIIAKNKGSTMRAVLLKINRATQDSLKQVMPPEKAAFMSGLTLGATAEFSEEFEEKLRLTGTSHMVALSGYNISVIGYAVLLALSRWFSRRGTLIATFFVILGFVVMTGAEASVVRAAIIGILIMIADQAGRQYYFRNALALAAFLMVLFNPKVLVFDLGFQLSFLAIIGIAYLRPLLKKWLRMKDEPGILNWRDNFLTTTSAQIAVLPLLLSNFGYFSPISILANILILEFIPPTMFLGFLTAALSVVSFHLSLLSGWIAQVFLGYILWVIDLCSKIIAIFT